MVTEVESIPVEVLLHGDEGDQIVGAEHIDREGATERIVRRLRRIALASPSQFVAAAAVRALARIGVTDSLPRIMRRAELQGLIYLLLVVARAWLNAKPVAEAKVGHPAGHAATAEPWV